MHDRVKPTRPRRSWLFSVLASLALAAQFVVALAPLGEGRQGRSMSAHVESGATKGHYTHDEATCVSCQARSMHGAIAKADVGFAADRPDTTVLVVPDERVASVGFLTHANPRAPPVSVI